MSTPSMASLPCTGIHRSLLATRIRDLALSAHPAILSCLPPPLPGQERGLQVLWYCTAAGVSSSWSYLTITRPCASYKLATRTQAQQHTIRW